MTKNEKKIVYVDMDNVLSNFAKRYIEKRIANPKNDYPQSEYGFFLKLEEIVDSVDSVKELDKHYDVWILTAPSVSNPFCYLEKRVWVEDHLGFDWVKKLIISPNKGLLMGDYLIDDTPWKSFTGKQLQFGQYPFVTWKDVLKFLVPEKA